MVPTIYYHFWVRYHPSGVYSQKKLRLETKYRSLFPTTIKPHPLNPLDRGSTFVVLAGYKVVVLRPLCACSTIFCFCLLPFPLCFCCNKLALFCSVACLCLISSCISCCVCLFPQFGFSFLHAFPAADTFCCSLFLFTVLFSYQFSHLSFIQKDLGLCGPNNVDWIKRVLSPIFLCLPKPFCQRTVLCSRFVFCCRSIPLALFSLDLYCSLVFLVGLWALLFIGLSFVQVFGYGFAKMGINRY